MNTDTAPNAPSSPSLLQPHDLLAEGARARKLSTNSEGVMSLVQGIRLVNDAILAQVLFGLWDSGFYEYSLAHSTFLVQDAADDLRLDATLLQWLMDYLEGRGIVLSTGGHVGLTEHGVRLSNILLHGTMNLYVGGWGPQLANIGPLLRKEISQDEYRNLRSGRHTVKGTEQLSCVRTVPTVSRALAQKKLQGILHIASRTGEFLVELARLEPALHGLGVDKVGERVVAAQAKALHHGVDSRLRFVRAEFGLDPLPVDRETLDKIDAVVALFLFHEVYRHGRQKVVDLLKQIKALFPGRLLLFMETVPAPTHAQGKKPPETFSQLDYLLIHRLRDQGLPLPPTEWRSILDEANVRFLEVQEVYWSALYLADL